MDRERTTETERRRATVLFTDITGFTALNEQLDPEDAYSVITGCLKALDSVARHHGGSVEKYLGDALMVVFGVPLAIEEASKAAVNAAIEMHARVLEYNVERSIDPPLDVHSGINTGVMISGDVSGPMLREFAVMGDAVNVAARLKDMAPRSEIWVGDETYRQTRDDFDYTPLPPMQIKGKQRSLAIYRLESREAKTHHREPRRVGSPLIGREAEVARLREKLVELASGGGGVVAVTGEAGVGKSRLVAELSAMSDEVGVQWFGARCLSIGEQLAFHPVQDLLRGWAGAEEASNTRVLRTAVDEAAMRDLDASECEEVLPFLANLLGLERTAAERRRLHGIEGEALDRLRLGAISSLFKAIALRKPTVIAIEDAQWADRSSVEFLKRLLTSTQGSPLLFILIARPEDADASASLIDDAREQTDLPFAEIEVAPLGRRASSELLDQLLGGARIPPALRDAIEERTAGNPLFIEEVTRSLVEQRALESREGGLRATSAIHEASVPASVHDLITARIDRLAPDLRTTLQVASVLGRSFPPTWIEALAGQDGATQRLAELVERGFLQEFVASAGLEYDFSPPLVRDVCYEAILREVRERYHQETAIVLEAEVSPSAAGYAGMLAYHFTLGGRRDLAEEYLLMAGEEASSVAASNEALHFFEEAWIRYAPDSAEPADADSMARLQTQLAHAQFHRGRFSEAVGHFDEALRLLGSTVIDAPKRAIGRTASTLVRCLPGLFVPALEPRGREATDRDRERLDLMYKRARAETTAEPVRFIIDTLEILRTLSAVDPSTVEGVGGFYSGFSGLFSYAGLPGLARRFLARAEVYTNRSEPHENFQLGFFRFLLEFLEGNWSSDFELPESACDELLRRGVLWDLCTYLGLLAKKRVYQGRFDDAKALVERLREIEVHYAYDLARENRCAAEAFLEVEAADEFVGVDACRAYVSASAEILPNVIALGTLAKAYALGGKLELARNAISDCDALMKDSTTTPPLHTSAVERSRLMHDVFALEHALAAGDRSSARHWRKAAQKSAKAARRASRTVAWRRIEVGRLSGRLALLSGNPRSAAREWQKALESAEGLGMLAERVRLHLEIARFLRTSGSASDVAGADAAGHIARARDCARTLPAEWVTREFGRLDEEKHAEESNS